MRKQFLEAGKIVAAHGIGGDMRVECWCNSPQVLCDLSTIYLNEGHIALQIEKARPYKTNMVLLKIKDINDTNAVLCMRGDILWLDRNDIELDEDEYFIQDLIGMKVIDADDSNKCYGEICDVSQTGANDVYHIKAEDGKIYLIPAIPDVVISSDLDTDIMHIRPIKGLFDDED